MKFIVNVVFCLFPLIQVITGRINTNELFQNNVHIKDVIRDSIEIYIYNYGAIDLTGLGPLAYGAPNKESGEALAAWKESSLMNPEEMGNYFEGDILFPMPVLRSGNMNVTHQWTGGCIPYVIEGNFSKEEKDLIMEAMDHYHRFTCVRFIQHKDQDDYLAITNDLAGCSSSIGRIGGRQTVNYADYCLKFGTILHELMHTLGFMHEVSREDRDDYVTILEENIEEGRMDDFKAYQSKLFNVPYDYSSILHYSEYFLSKSADKKTIMAKKNTFGLKLGQRSRLSRGDITKINRMYKCDSNSSTC